MIVSNFAVYRTAFFTIKNQWSDLTPYCRWAIRIRLLFGYQLLFAMFFFGIPLFVLKLIKVFSLEIEEELVTENIALLILSALVVTYIIILAIKNFLEIFFLCNFGIRKNATVDSFEHLKRGLRNQLIYKIVCRLFKKVEYEKFIAKYTLRHRNNVIKGRGTVFSKIDTDIDEVPTEIEVLLSDLNPKISYPYSEVLIEKFQINKNPQHSL